MAAARQASRGMTIKRILFIETINTFAFVKNPENVIPAQAGIQSIQALIDSRFRRNDERSYSRTAS